MELNVKVGCDPEIFVVDCNNNSVPAWKLIPGTKDEPYPVEDGAVQVDGMALEFNINPAENEHEWIDNIRSVMRTLKGMIPNFNFAITPTQEFDYSGLPAEALEIGCEPDYDAWNGGKRNPRPDCKANYRSAAGHIHLSWNGSNKAPKALKCAIVKYLDLFLGVTSLAWDTDTKRRTLYGKAGAMRFKSYGLEYRTLSNMWLKDEKTMRYVYSQANKAVDKFFNAYDERIVNDVRIQQCINTADKELAKQILNDYSFVEVYNE